MINQRVLFEASESSNSLHPLETEMNNLNKPEHMDEEEDEFSSFEIIEGTEDTEETLFKIGDGESQQDWHKTPDEFNSEGKEYTKKIYYEGDFDAARRIEQMSEVAKEMRDVAVFQRRVYTVCCVALLVMVLAVRV